MGKDRVMIEESKLSADTKIYCYKLETKIKLDRRKLSQVTSRGLGRIRQG